MVIELEWLELLGSGGGRVPGSDGGVSPSMRVRLDARRVKIPFIFSSISATRLYQLAVFVIG